MTKIAIVIPAAGSSSRMRGADKLLEPAAGVPLLRRVASRARAQCDLVIVTLPAIACPRADALRGLDLSLIAVPDAAEGMAASLRRASAEMPPDVQGMLILPADMPDITGDDLQTVIGAFGDAGGQQIVQATGDDGTPGHPVIFPSDLFAEFSALAGDAGARSILQANRDRLIRVALPGAHALTDLDTPEAWATWRSANPDA